MIHNNNSTTEKIDIFLLKNYGFRQAAQIKSDSKKKRDLYRTIIISELNKAYKYPEAVTLF